MGVAQCPTNRECPTVGGKADLVHRRVGLYLSQVMSQRLPYASAIDKSRAIPDLFSPANFLPTRGNGLASSSPVA